MLQAWKGRELTRTGKILLLLVIAAAIHARAESPNASPSDEKAVADNPVAAARAARSWEYGPFVNWGTGVGDR